MAANITTQTDAHAAVQARTTLTIRIPRGFGDGSLTESAQTRLENIDCITHASIENVGSVTPRGGATFLTVTAALTATIGTTTPETTLETALEDTVSVDSVESVTANEIG